MKLSTARVIHMIYQSIEDSEPDISTEQLLERTRQEATNRLHWELDNGHVCDALEMMNKTEAEIKGAES